MSDRFDVVVIGAGLAGLSAALFAARYGLRTAIVDRVGLGGQVINAAGLDAYPGLDASISGATFVGRLSDQVLDLGVEPELAAATRITADGNDGFVVETETRPLTARRVIAAMGGTPIALGIRGEKELEGRGVSHCAVCDGAFFAGQDVVVVGGGDAALDSALYLSATSRKVLLVHRRTVFRGAMALQRKVQSKANVELALGCEVEAIRGEAGVQAIALRGANGEVVERAAGGIFVCVGLAPETSLLQGLVELDSARRAIVDLQMQTSRPGLYAVGSLRAGSPDQPITAAADGATAARAAHASLMTCD